MRAIRLGVCVSLAVLVQLFVVSSASAQAPGTGPGGYPAPAEGTPPPAAAPAPPPATPPAPYGAYPPPAVQQPYGTPVMGPVVRLRTNHPKARLQQMQLKWVDVCTTPCGIPADPSALYRVGGGSLRASDPFKLPRPTGEVLIDAHVGSTVKHWVGFGIMLGGIAGAGLGSLYLLAGNSTSSTNEFGTTTTSDAYKVVGVTYIIIGVILMAVGIPLFVGSNTSVDVR